MKMDPINWLRKQLDNDESDMVREMVKTFAEQLMSAEADLLCGAERGTRSEDRVNRRNGYRKRRWDTRAGTIELNIPKLRQGTYFPSWLLEQRRRSERALVSAVATSWVLGVSTRRVDKLVKALGIDGISKSQVSEMAKELDGEVKTFRERPLDSGPYRFVWLDALALKCREDRRVVNVACLVAVGVNAEGKREVLGIDVVTSETGAGWLAFLRGLVARGLSGVELVVSDAHAGLVDAISSAITGASWQRCRTHFARNLLSRVPKKAQDFVATIQRTIYQQPGPKEVREQHSNVVEQLRSRFPDAAQLLDEAREDILAFTAFPKAVWRQIWSNNPQERVRDHLVSETP